MTAPNPVQNRVRFDDVEVDLRTEEVFRSGRRIRLPHQSFRVLAILLERAGQLVTRDELRAQLWPAGTFVEYDQGLNAAIKRLREALRDSADAPRFIETLPKRGYRFIAAPEVDVSSPPTPTAQESKVAATEPVATADSAPVAAANTSPVPGRTRFLGSRLFVAICALGTVALIGVASWLTTHRSDAPAQTARQIVPFTSFPGQEVAPSFSPDGSQIAFGWNGDAGVAGRHFDLYVKSLGSERLLRLTHRPAQWIAPAWSPDGSSIAYLRWDEEDPGVFIIPALGGAERRIVSTAVAVGSFRQLSWSPDSKSLAYSAYGPKGAPQVYVVALDSLQITPLSPAPDCLDATDPAFSPDGKRLAFVCLTSAAVYSIYMRELPDGPLKPLATIMGYPQGLAWSADATRLIFSNDPGDGGELWQLTLNGNLTQLPFGENSSAPAIARDGRVAYVRGRNTTNIWRADLTAADPEGSAVRLIYSTVSQTVPRFAPDGAHVAFESNRSGSSEIWMADADGSDAERLTSFNGPLASSPSWCSDGRHIAFDSRASGTSDLYVEEIGERVPRKVVTSRANLSGPVWSPDCRTLFAHDGNMRLYRIPAAGGSAARINDRSVNSAVVAADRVVFGVTEPSGIILWSRPLDGGTEERLEGMPRVRYDDSWFATPRGVYYTDSGSKPVGVSFYDFATRMTRQVMTLRQTPVPAGSAIAVSPDGRWLLFSQIDDEQSDIMVARDQ